MARQTRVFLNNIPILIELVGNDELKLFKEDDDYLYFLKYLEDLCTEFSICVHSYVLVERNILLLLSSNNKNNISKFLQKLNLIYVKYYNTKYSHSGSIWKDRYKSSIVEKDIYFYDVIKYIEKLPLKLAVCNDPIKYRFSSVRHNLNLKKSAIIKNNINREVYERIFFSNEDSIRQLFIDNCIKKQKVIGREHFIKKLETIIDQPLTKKRGRPKKSESKFDIFKEKKMYKNLVVLDKVIHKDLKINPIQNLNFVKDIGFIPVLADEIRNISISFPVVFSGDKNTTLITLVGLSSTSLAVTNDGKWITNYIPAFIRKYPFNFASTKNNPNQKIILFDQESELFDNQNGKSLFENGEATETLDDVVKFLSKYEESQIKTQKIINEILKHDILEDREIAIDENSENKKVLVNGFKVIDKEKLNNLDDKTLANWTKNGIMTFIDEHLKSLNNIQTLFNLLQARQK